LGSQASIVDITKMDEYRKYLNTCLVGPPSKACQRRIEYSKNAIAKGFRKKLLISDGQVVGQIEYSPAEVSYYPIIGENLIVMNCIWVLKRAKGHDFGKKLLRDMIESEKEAYGFATIALENHWSPWFRKEQIEKLGFKPIGSIRVTHKTKYKDRVFHIYLMWMPNSKAAKPPTWNAQKLLEGTTACTAHPFYHPQTYEPRQILQKHDESRAGSPDESGGLSFIC
jgi:ribosomal protein S18 acetylase RimI-like enzyme